MLLALIRNEIVLVVPIKLVVVIPVLPVIPHCEKALIENAIKIAKIKIVFS